MKKIILALIMLLPGLLFSQRIKKEQVPSEVQKAFLTRFPNSLMVKWSRGEASYEVDFQQNEDNIAAIFDEKGTWLSTQAEIDISKVPAIVKKSYALIYKSQAEDAEKIEKAAGEVEYVLESPDGSTTLFYSEKGVLLHKESNE